MPTRQLWLVAPERYSLRSYPAAGHPVWVGMTFYSNSGTQTLLEFTHLTVIKGIADFGSCLKFVHVAPSALRLRWRYAQDERGMAGIRTDSVHEPLIFWSYPTVKVGSGLHIDFMLSCVHCPRQFCVGLLIPIRCVEQVQPPDHRKYRGDIAAVLAFGAGSQTYSARTIRKPLHRNVPYFPTGRQATEPFDTLTAHHPKGKPVWDLKVYPARRSFSCAWRTLLIKAQGQVCTNLLWSDLGEAQHSVRA